MICYERVAHRCVSAGTAWTMLREFGTVRLMCEVESTTMIVGSKIKLLKSMCEENICFVENFGC